MGRYNSQLHSEVIECKFCGAKNAPRDSNDYDSDCYQCHESLIEADVEIGEIIEVDVVDIHSSGAGVCKTKSGYVILVDGLLPEKHARVEVTNISDSQSYAEGKHVETVDDSLKWDDEEKEKDEEDARRGKRENFWG